MADEKEFAEAGKGTTLKGVEIFSAGTWSGSRKVTVDGSMLDSIVANFAAVNSIPGYGVPIKLGHNKKIGEPAYGWMSALERIDNTLVADFDDVDPAIVDAISKRRYNSVSVELWPVVEHAGNTFENVLSGVALLGAEWPAVKGLKPLSASVFSQESEKIELSHKEPDMTFTEDQHATLLAAAVKTAKEDAVKEFTAKLAQAEADVATATAKVTAAEGATKEAEAKVAEFQAAAEKSEIAAIITAAEAKGAIVPANKAAVEAFAEQVRTAATGESRKALMASFKGFVEAMPAKVKFGEQGKAKQDAVESGASAADQVHEKVQAHMAANKGSTYEKSMQAVFAAEPELKTAYAQEM